MTKQEKINPQIQEEIDLLPIVWPNIAGVIEQHQAKTYLKIFVVVIPKDRMVGRAPPILLLAWHQIYHIICKGYKLQIYRLTASSRISTFLKVFVTLCAAQNQPNCLWHLWISTHCIHFVFLDLEKMPSLQKWPVLDTVSHSQLYIKRRMGAFLQHMTQILRG